ncbi:MAG: signal peptidase [Bacteroidota bacterium]|jgi:signal peptidase I
MEEELKTVKSYSRKKLLAFLLSALVPGLGQLYNGQPRKLLFYTTGIITLSIGFNLLELKQYFWAYIVLIGFIYLLKLVIAIEAAIAARHKKEYQLKSYNKWYIYIVIIPVWYLAVFAGESLTQNTRYKTFRASSDSGNPNLTVGDYVLADFDFYNSRLPDYGDLIVFSNSSEGSQVFRIIGLPNDTLSISDNLAKYKNKNSIATFLSNLTWKETETEEFIETLPNGVKYRIYRNKKTYDAEKATIKDIVVPPESYFVLGDNRDNSADSRYFGFVQRKQIQGKLLTLYFSRDFSKFNISLTN